MNTRIFAFIFLLTWAASLVAAPASGKIRTIANTPALASKLQQEIDPAVYEKLGTYPIEAWIIVRGKVTGNHLSGTAIAQSDINGTYDSLALKLVNGSKLYGFFTTDTRIPNEISFHVLIYNFGKKRMALVFIHAEQMRYHTSPYMVSLKAGTLEPEFPRSR